MGIGGDWLKCMKELYRNNKIRGIGSKGMTEWVNVKRGIKQGCPMSPILFAIYTSMIPAMMEQEGCGKKDEPMLLMYADDMVVWGKTEEIIKKKIEIICKGFDMLGLKLSSTKTELQHNQYVVPSKEGQILSIVHNNMEEKITYLPINKAIRYLGAWTTRDGNSDWGLELLKTKLEDRLKRINRLNLHATQKATLIKGKILSAWSYTAGIQNIDEEEIEKLEKTLCKAVASKDMGRAVRRDMLFEKRVKGGIDMISMHDLYDINRCRIISQIMENGKRQEGRGQIPWAERIVMEELMTDRPPCMAIYEEILHILVKMGLKIQQNRRYKLWKTQDMVYEQTYERINEVSESTVLHNTKVDIVQEGMYIPAHLIEWYENTDKSMKEMGIATSKAMDRMKMLQGIRSGSGKDIYTGIRMKEILVIKLEEVLKKDVWEAVIMPELICTKRAWRIKRIIQLLKREITPGLIILNLTHSEGLLVEEDSEDVQNMIEEARKKQVPIIVFTNEEAEEIGKEESWTVDRACAKQLVGWESPYEHVIIPILEVGENINSHLSTWGNRENINIMDIVFNKAYGAINNMYQITADIEDMWKCPVCRTDGIKINEHYGYCLADKCVGVCIPRSVQEVSRNKIRKVENIVMDCRVNRRGPKVVKNFFTDGSGVDITPKVKHTAWAWVEVEWDMINRKLLNIQTKGSRSPHLNSVQWCEAKAILEAVKETPKNAIAHVHTDSKGTIQGLRAILAATATKIKKLKQKDILSQIVEDIYEGEKMLIIEWVKGHENMEWEKHNWISKLKQTGNEWADREARKAISEEPEDAPDQYDKYSLYTADTGKKVMWTELPDFCRIWHDKQRGERLENPTKEVFEHGSGAYMKESRKNRTLAFKTLKKVGCKQESWYYHTLKYMMNTIFTRKWIMETGRKQGKAIIICNTEVQDQYCPICTLVGRECVQTKEHIWSGECEGTKELVSKWEYIVRDRLENIHIKEQTIIDIIEKIKTEREKVNTKEYNIKTHGIAAALTGMWSNDTIIEIRNLIMYDGWEAGNAMQMTMALMQEMQKIVEEIAFRFQCNLDIFIKNLTEEEIEEYKKVVNTKDTNNSRIRAVKYNKWKDVKISGLDRDTWEYWAYVKDQAIRQHMPTKEVEIQIQKLMGKQRIKMLQEVKKYKEWHEVPVRLVEEIIKERNKEMKYKRKRKEEITDIIIHLVNRHENKPSIVEIIANNKLYLKQAWDERSEDMEVNSMNKRSRIERENKGRSFLGDIKEYEIVRDKPRLESDICIITEEQEKLLGKRPAIFLGDIEEYEIKHKKARINQDTEMQEEVEIIRAEELELNSSPPRVGSQGTKFPNAYQGT
ncbi:MAG: hypothetical protein GY739_06910 [Mesoflavibacter sp.]|nr:hypothetical protein [Mesoflavibacter sp.]